MEGISLTTAKRRRTEENDEFAFAIAFFYRIFLKKTGIKFVPLERFFSVCVMLA